MHDENILDHLARVPFRLNFPAIRMSMNCLKLLSTSHAQLSSRDAVCLYCS